MPYKDPEDAKAWRKQYYLDNKAKMNADNKAWHKNNPGRYAEHLRKKYATDPSYVQYRKRFSVRNLNITGEQIDDLRSQDCFYCGVAGGTIDHLTPTSRGATGDLWNLVPACHRCNCSKNKQTPEEFYAKNPLKGGISANEPE